MKLFQLRYIWEIAQHDLNISTTAEQLFTSQPGISKQLRLLEEELGIAIFDRNGKHLKAITPAGRAIIEKAGEILGRVQSIKEIAQEHQSGKVGGLNIGATHAQARYILPSVVREFMRRYPNVQIHIHQGTPRQIAEEASEGAIDMAITTEALDQYENLAVVPCYEWNRCLLVPIGHPLTAVKEISLQLLAEYPLVTYVHGFSGRAQIDQAFEKNQIHPNVALTAVDADVIKTYVRLGLGVGIIAEMAYEPSADADLVALPAGHLFGRSVTKLGLRKNRFIHRFVFEFIQLFAPKLSRELIESALASPSKPE
jgi:LysR family transcriptional regulator, cys regulon transcriptional activator